VNILRFDHQIIFIYVRNLKKSSAFYEGIMGFPLVLDQGGCRIIQTAEGGYLGYCDRGGRSLEEKSLILTLVTTRVDDWYAYLQEKEVEIFEPPKINPEYDIYHFFLKDPDGYLVEIQQFLDPTWADGGGNQGAKRAGAEGRGIFR